MTTAKLSLYLYFILYLYIYIIYIYIYILYYIFIFTFFLRIMHIMVQYDSLPFWEMHLFTLFVERSMRRAIPRSSLHSKYEADEGESW